MKKLEDKLGKTASSPKILSSPKEAELRPTPYEKEQLRKLLEWQRMSERSYWVLGVPREEQYR